MGYISRIERILTSVIARLGRLSCELKSGILREVKRLFRAHVFFFLAEAELPFYKTGLFNLFSGIAFRVFVRVAGLYEPLARLVAGLYEKLG